MSLQVVCLQKVLIVVTVVMIGCLVMGGSIIAKAVHGVVLVMVARPMLAV